MNNVTPTTRAIISLACAGLLIVPTFCAAKASKEQIARAEVTFDTLRVAKPTFLVSNPFYGLTDLVRGMKVTMASDRINKTAALLEQLDRKAAELIQTKSVAPDSNRLINLAITEYQLAVYQYSNSLSRFASADLGSDSRGADFINNAVTSGIVNLRLIDELLATSQPSDQAALIDMLERLADANVKLFNDVIGFDSVRVRVLADAGTDASADVRTAEMFALLTKRAAALGLSDAAQQAANIRGTLLSGVAEHFDEANIDFVTLAGSHAEHLQTISYLLGTATLSQNTELMNLRNRFVFEVFSK